MTLNGVVTALRSPTPAMAMSLSTRSTALGPAVDAQGQLRGLASCRSGSEDELAGLAYVALEKPAFPAARGTRGGERLRSLSQTKAWSIEVTKRWPVRSRKCGARSHRELPSMPLSRSSV